MSRIQVSNLTFAYGGSYDNIFENVSFQIDTDWKLGFIGRNGRGKTTFLNLLLGKYDYSGTISASTDFEYFPYEVENPDAMTLSIVESINPAAENWQIFRELNLLDVETEILYRPFSTLSNGERTKVLLAALFLRENGFLLIDEPTNHLDIPAREKVAQYLNSKKGFILVSHDRMFLDGCIDHVLSINKNNIEVQKGNFSSWYANKEAQDSLELEQNARLSQDIRRLQDSARQSGKWSDKIEKTKIGTHAPDRGHIGHQAAKMMKRSKSIEKRRQNAISEKEKLLKNIESADSLRLNPLTYHTDVLLSMENISISYGSTDICHDISFSIRQGERICLKGKNGSGKTSLIKLILGEPVPYNGDFRLGSGVKISYISQDTSWLKGNLADFARIHQLGDSVFKALLRKLGFDRMQFDKDIEQFSEGQKKKVLLAKSLCEPAHLFIWDEPLNFIDVLSRIQIEELIMEYKPTMLFVEHDEMFQKNISTQVVEVSYKI
ncbi:ribosomal protection-like ABC-F family protein [Clostridium sp. C105KSO13]|uniref:ribosomal protection-like ABC-F family protein n=1 Tax=Clostridium sp. C105KSO13 TaxID=1776045 RepID=UPI0007405AC0|nr:ABC-F type ribosomal protection protein [Clostridium sp. C105KSO13]CUX45495.1 putative ABC transporter ATP-binding protein YheS [Clostridium sp. C105KSO13]